MLPALLTMLVAALGAVWASVERVRRSRGEAPATRRPRPCRLGLVLAGVAATALSYAAGEALFPLIRLSLWSVVRAVGGWPDSMENEASVYEVAQLIAVSGATCLLTFAIGAAVGYRRYCAPLDGYWLANPVSTALGYYALHLSVERFVGLPAAEYSPWIEYTYWSASPWFGVVVLGCPVYAWLFVSGAEAAKRVTGARGGLTTSCS